MESDWGVLSGDLESDWGVLSGVSIATVVLELVGSGERSHFHTLCPTMPAQRRAQPPRGVAQEALALVREAIPTYSSKYSRKTDAKKRY